MTRYKPTSKQILNIYKVATLLLDHDNGMARICDNEGRRLIVTIGDFAVDKCDIYRFVREATSTSQTGIEGTFGIPVKGSIWKWVVDCDRSASGKFPAEVIGHRLLFLIHKDWGPSDPLEATLLDCHHYDYRLFAELYPLVEMIVRARAYVGYSSDTQEVTSIMAKYGCRPTPTMVPLPDRPTVDIKIGNSVDDGRSWHQMATFKLGAFDSPVTTIQLVTSGPGAWRIETDPTIGLSADTIKAYWGLSFLGDVVGYYELYLIIGILPKLVDRLRKRCEKPTIEYIKSLLTAGPYNAIEKRAKAYDAISDAITSPRTADMDLDRDWVDEQVKELMGGMVANGKP